jgi:hypothetical protein
VDDTFLPDTAGDSMTLQWVAALLAASSYEAAVTGSLRDALEIDNLRNTIVTLKATSTERYAQFL